MRHRKKGRKLGRTSAHRKALRQNLAKALLEHERIVTTEAKAKETRPFVEKLITLARKAQPLKDADSREDRARYVHLYRLALTRLQDKSLVQKLFGEGPWRESGSLAARYADRPSGQTRILKIGGSRLGTPIGYAVEATSELDYEMAGNSRSLKLVGHRLGDNATQVIFELVREHEIGPEEEAAAPRVDGSEEDQALPAGAGEAGAEEATDASDETPPSDEDVQEDVQEGPESHAPEAGGDDDAGEADAGEDAGPEGAEEPGK